MLVNCMGIIIIIIIKIEHEADRTVHKLNFKSKAKMTRMLAIIVSIPKPEDRPPCAVLTAAIWCINKFFNSPPPYNLTRRSPSMFNRTLPNLVKVSANNHWWTLLFSIFYFHSTSWVMALNMLRLGMKWGEIWGFRSLFLLGALSRNRHSSASFGGWNQCHVIVEKFRVHVCRLTDVEKSELTDEKEETCVKHKIAFAERAM